MTREVCYVCGNGERKLRNTVDENLRICEECDRRIKRNKNFSDVSAGFERLEQLLEEEET